MCPHWRWKCCAAWHNNSHPHHILMLAKCNLFRLVGTETQISLMDLSRLSRTVLNYLTLLTCIKWLRLNYCFCFFSFVIFYKIKCILLFFAWCSLPALRKVHTRHKLHTILRSRGSLFHTGHGWSYSNSFVGTTPSVWANIQPTTYSHKCKHCADLKNVHPLKNNTSQKCQRLCQRLAVSLRLRAPQHRSSPLNNFTSCLDPSNQTQ